MAASDLILQVGQVLVRQDDSRLGITDATEGFLFGIVVKVYSTSDKTESDQYVLFNPTAAMSSFKISNIQYWIIREELISINEGATPP